MASVQLSKVIGYDRHINLLSALEVLLIVLLLIWHHVRISLFSVSHLPVNVFALRVLSSPLTSSFVDVFTLVVFDEIVPK